MLQISLGGMQSGDWYHRICRTMYEQHLARLQRDALDPDAIKRMIALIEAEQGLPLYDAVGRLKRELSVDDRAVFHFEGGGVTIAAEVRRDEFEGWIATDLQRIETTMINALAAARMQPNAVDRVFLTGGSSLIPAIRGMFDRHFGEERIATGGEFTSIAHGLAQIGSEPDPVIWTA
ncbi:Hsp70 family protein [Glacieibacterium frigidum]|uniref:Hsp70 family protein n=1 Tax=Glacieibacterium frigidum TaxID=2593303 RepID=A0A552UAV5_9SPHN|nr:Hsp70 family protein [Glacieibacterium frigidum]